MEEKAVPLKQLRIKADMTQVHLSRVSGVSQQAISKIEKGNSVPSYQSAIKFAEALNCTPEEVMGFKPKKKKSTLDELKAKLNIHVR